MATDLTLDADLAFSLHVPGLRPLGGTLTGSGTALELRVSDPFVFAGRQDASAIRGVAAGLARHGLSLTVLTPSGPLVTLGRRRTSWVQRRITGSRHIRVERGAGLWSLLRGRTGAPDGGVLPTAALAPPATLLPVAPTFRRLRHRPTTTHDPGRGGSPRLVMTPTQPLPGERRRVFRLRDGETTVGSGADCDIRLGGLEPLHAVVRHDDADEFVLVRAAAPGTAKVHGAPVDSAVLRSGSRVELGALTLAFYREEFADHGRPYGGRVGGELGHQRPQPPRPTIDRSASADGRLDQKGST